MSETRLTTAELHHLIAILMSEKDSGEYAGNRQQYYDRTLRLINRFQRQLEAAK